MKSAALDRGYRFDLYAGSGEKPVMPGRTMAVEQGQISVDSPLGRALMRKREGDAVVVRRPRGDATYEILDVRYRPFESD